MLATALTAIAIPASAQKQTREQVKMDTLRFLKMYRYDESGNEWIGRMR